MVICNSLNETSRAAAFLDRDGVINVDRNFVVKLEDLEFTSTAIEGIRLLNGAGYRVIVATNQSGVARGYFGVDDVKRFHKHIQTELKRADAWIDAFYFCPYHPKGTVPAFAIDHPDRKPNPGMLLRAIKDWAIKPEGSFMIGDKRSDMVAAERAGVVGILAPKNSCDLAGIVRSQLCL